VIKYIFKRFILGIIVLWVVASLTFFLAHAIPGGPFDFEKQLPEEILNNLNAKYNLDKPVTQQYVQYMKDLLRGDFGPSFRYSTETVNEIIARAFPVSATIGVLALTLAIMLGIPAGIIAALKQNKWQDDITMVATTLLISVPNFVLATLLMYVFAYKLRLVPAALWGMPSQAILPTIALTGYPLAYITKLTRSSTLEVMGQDYIRTAKAKGMPSRIVIYVHAIKNSILPIITILGPIFTSILMGSLVVEKIFAIPGLGQHLISGILNRDYTVIMGITIFYSFILIISLLIVDIAYVIVDPRIKLEGDAKR